MGRLRVCQMIAELHPTGATRAVYELATRLDRDRFDVRVVALCGGEVSDWLADAGVKVTVLGSGPSWGVLKLCRLATLLRSDEIDLVHTHMFRADLGGRAAACLAGTPHLVHTVHTAEGPFRPWRYAFARFFSNRCDRLVSISSSVQEMHSRLSGLPDWHYTVIPNGVDPEAFKRDDEARQRLRRTWDLADDRPLAAFVGRLAEDKGVEMLLSAMSHLGARGTPVDLVIAGEGPKRRVIENFVAHGEGGSHCRILGFVRDIRSVFSAADMLIVPSRWEGWPLAAGEAMAVGLPVVGTDVAGLRDVVVNGKTGILVGPENVVDLAGAVERLANDPALRARLGQAGRDHIVSDFGIDGTVAAHERLYAEIAAGRKGRS